jgi:ATP-dependent Clp protease ATP-binding subunit ClpC
MTGFSPWGMLSYIGDQVFERYSEPARRTIFFARWWANNRKSREIEPSDIIIGAAWEVRRHSQQLEWMNLDYESMVALFGGGVVRVEKRQAKDVSLTKESKIALAYAAQEVELDSRFSLEVYHLVRGVLRTDCHAAKTLSSAGFTLDSLREGSRDANRNLSDVPFHTKVKWQLQRLRWMFSLREWLTLGFALLALIATILYLRSQN